MATEDLSTLLSGEIFEEGTELTLAELCRACGLPAERVFSMVEEGIVEPVGREPAAWRFRAISVQRVRCAQRLEQDLGINLAGAALAIELLEDLARMRARVRRLEG